MFSKALTFTAVGPTVVDPTVVGLQQPMVSNSIHRKTN